MARTPLLDPGTYFADDRRNSLERAAVVVLAYGLVTVLVRTAATALETPETGAIVGAIQTWLPFALATTILFWLGPAALLYGLATVTAGDGGPIDAVRVAAWGLGAGIVVWLVAFLVLILPASIVGNGASAYGPGVWFGTTLTLYVGALGWAGYIWAHGLVETFDLEWQVAVRTVAVVVAVLFALLIGDLATVG